MIRLRLVALLAGLGALLACAPALGRPVPDAPLEESPAVRDSRPGLPLLVAAARAARTQAWRGTQRVVASGTPESHLEVRHVPGHGSEVRGPDGTPVVAADVLDESLLSLLENNYEVRVAGAGRCAGRLAVLVEAVRPGVVGPGAVAARFWVDRASALLLRRDVHDGDGSLLRSAEMTWLEVRPGVRPVEQEQERAGSVLRPRGERLTTEALALLAEQGWPVPRSLPRGFELYDARLLDGQVLQLAYSDGLSTTSVFAQRGALPVVSSGLVREVDGASVWHPAGEPGRLVWSADGLAFTLVSDASADARDAAVAALPHAHEQVTEEGLLPRVWRGLDRVGSWLNPFG